MDRPAGVEGGFPAARRPPVPAQRHPHLAHRLRVAASATTRRRLLGLCAVIAVINTASAASTGGPAAARTPATRVGFSFRPHTVAGMGLDPTSSLATLLERTDPDVVRLPIYWSDVAPTPGSLDFSSVDRLLAVVAGHNAVAGPRPTRVVLVVGMRNEGYPELFVPDWALARAGLSTDGLSRQPEYSQYLSTAVSRYAASPLLDSWQVENEPLDSSVPPDQGDTSVSLFDVQWEVTFVHALDARHQVMVTSFNSSTLDLDEVGIAAEESSAPPPPAIALVGGHPDQSLAASDILGLDLYVVYAGVDLNDPDVETRIIWKRNSLPFWAARAQAMGRSLWIAEMQAAPWKDVDGFTPSDLALSAVEYCGRGATTVLLWGAESWLKLPEWEQAGKAAFATLRSPQCDGGRAA